MKYNKFNQIFEGSFFNIGKQIGKIYKKNGMNIDDIQVKKEILKNQKEIYQKYYPEKIKMISGMASCGYDLDKLTYYILWHQCPRSSRNCSIFGIKKNDTIYVGRNYDGCKKCANLYQTYNINPDEENSFIGISDMNIIHAYKESEDWEYITEDAINNKGLYIGMTFAFFINHSYGLLPGDVIELLSLKCKDIDECIEFFKHIPIALPKNYFIADKFGNMVVVEHTGREYRTIYPENDILIHTNHYLHSYFKEKDKIYICNPDTDSFKRYNKIKTDLCDIKNISDISIILKNSPVYVDHDGIITLWSLILDMKNRIYEIF